MITSIIRYHTAIHYIMSITRDRFQPYWVSSGGCKKHSIINMLKKTNLPLGAKKRKKKKNFSFFCFSFFLHCFSFLFFLFFFLHCFSFFSFVYILFFTKTFLFLYIAFFFFLHPMANLFFLAHLLLSVFYTHLMRPNKVETGRGLLT